MKTQITNHCLSSCTLRYIDLETDILRNRTFYAPVEGGYVREIFNPLKDGSQVCERLAHKGITLIWHPEKGYLSDLIRKEYKKARAQFLKRMAA